MCPTYDFCCDYCDMPHSIVQPMSEYNPHANIVCEHCGVGLLECAISAPLVIFKGSDWTPKKLSGEPN